MTSTEKTFLKSKKCLTFLILITCATALIAAGILKGCNQAIVTELVSTFGMSCGAGALALISGQAFIDSKAVSVTESPPESK